MPTIEEDYRVVAELYGCGVEVDCLDCPNYLDADECLFWLDHKAEEWCITYMPNLMYNGKGDIYDITPELI